MDFQQRYKYSSTDLLGKGGFSSVYKAYDSLFERTVALKFYESDAAGKYNLISEVKRTFALGHKNLVQYYDVQLIEVNDRLLGKKTLQVGILEYADGGDFRQFIKKLPPPDVLKNLITGVLEGLQYLHQKGFIHRDIKPHNIMVSKQGQEWEAKLTDFGLSKQIQSEYTSSSAIVGTMEYMAPEQIKVNQFGVNGKLGTNIDLWSFGVVLYELFFGLTPFKRKSNQDSKSAILTNILFNPLPDNISQAPYPYNLIMGRCLVKESANRARTADELLEILKKGKSSQPIEVNHQNRYSQSGVSAQKEAAITQAKKNYLLDYSGVLKDKKISVTSKLFVGRDFKSCQVVYPTLEVAVSRVHAVISTDPGNNIFVEDLGSSNGTYVNEKKLTPRQKHLLHAGDIICFGDEKFMLQLTKDNG